MTPRPWPAVARVLLVVGIVLAVGGVVSGVVVGAVLGAFTVASAIPSIAALVVGVILAAYAFSDWAQHPGSVKDYDSRGDGFNP